MLIVCQVLYRSPKTKTFKEDKGQIISQANYGILKPSKKTTNKFNFTTMIPQVDLLLFVFWRKLKTLKRHFEIN